VQCDRGSTGLTTALGSRIHSWHMTGWLFQPPISSTPREQSCGVVFSTARARKEGRLHCQLVGTLVEANAPQSTKLRHFLFLLNLDGAGDGAVLLLNHRSLDGCLCAPLMPSGLWRGV
jgi:hypothetical protein